MTWREIKEKIESLGVKDEDEICYIDITNLDKDIEAEKNEEENDWEIWS